MYAYIHYMTLNDISARGYVRQYCISYVSQTEKMLVDNFLSLKDSFDKVSTMLRCANLMLFLNDLIRRLKDLDYTGELIKQEGLEYDGNEADFTASHLYAEFDFCKQDVPERDINVVRQQMEEVTDILHIVLEEMNSSSIKKALQQLDQGGSHAVEHVEQLIGSIQQEGISFILNHLETDYQPTRTMAHVTYRFDRKLKPLSQLSTPVYRNARTELELIHKKFSRPFYALNIEKEEAKLLDPLSSLLTIGRTPLVNVMKNRKCDGRTLSYKPHPYKYSSLQHLQQESFGGVQFIHSDQGDQDNYCFDPSFLRTPDGLETFPIYMDPVPDNLSFNSSLEAVELEEDNGSRSPSPTVPPHLIPVLPSSEDQFMTPQDSSPSLHSISNSSPPISPSSNNLSDDANDTVRRNTFALPDDNMDFGFVLIPSNNTSNSTGDMSEPVEDVENTLRPADFKNVIDRSSSTEVGMDYDTAVPPGDNDTLVIINKNKSARNSSMLVEDQVIGLPGNKFSINEDELSVDSPLSAAKLLARRNSSRRALISLPELRITRLTSYGATSPEYYTPTDLIAKDSMSPSISVKLPLYEQPVVRVAGKLPLTSFTEQCIKHHKLRPGRRILEFVKNYPNCQDLFYALLSGRPLVISGKPNQQQRIKTIITALWMFVPGHSSQCQVIPWYTEPIKLQDLQCFKLIGHCSEGHAHHVIPQHIRPYISWWNCSENKLYTPRYEGTLLNSISRRTEWKSEQTFMAHIHSVLLDIATKAFVYYHLYCIAKREERPRDPLYSPTLSAKDHNIPSKKKIFLKLNIEKSDKDIIQYLSEVISYQQLAEWDEQASNGMTGIKLNYQKCSEQTCRGH
ncbi:guanine nucleotide exchange protein SMCR8-like isoform X2 [Dysidea avara]